MTSFRAALTGKNRVLFVCVVLNAIMMLALLAFSVRSHF